MKRTADVIVVGGGVIGTACAWALSREKLAVILVETETIACGASGVAQGGIGFGVLSEGWDLEWQLAALRAHDAAEEDGIDAEYDRCGALIVSASEDIAESLRVATRRLVATGVAADWIDAVSLRAVEPHLSKTFIGAVRRYAGGHLSPKRLSQALAKRAADRNASIVQKQTAIAIACSNGRVEGLDTSGGRISSPTVVLAAGLDSTKLAASAGLQLPLEPIKGHVVVAGPSEPLLRHYVVEHQVVKATADVHISTVLQSLRDGHTLIGMSRLRRDAITQDDRAVINTMVSRATDVLPALRGLPIVSERIGARPGTPDNRPIIGVPPGVDGLVIAAGHGGEGILGAPLTGLVVADIVRGRTPPLVLEPVSPARWTGVAT